MPEPKYQIGEMDLDPDRIRFTPRQFDSDAYGALHKFVVACSNGTATLYVSYGNHLNVAKRFELDHSIIAGGGSLYIDSEETLTLNDTSSNFGRAPRLVRQKLLDILAAELKARGIEVKATSVKQVSADREDEETVFAEDDMEAFLQKYFAD